MDVVCTLVMLRVEGGGLVLLPLTKPAQPLKTAGTSDNTAKSTQPCQEFWSSRSHLCACVWGVACRPFTKPPRCCSSEKKPRASQIRETGEKSDSLSLSSFSPG